MGKSRSLWVVMPGKLVVRPMDAEDVTPGGIILPENSREKPQRGVAIMVGVGRLLENGNYGNPMLEAGDEVVFAKFSGTEIQIDGEDFLLLDQADVLMAFRPTAASARQALLSKSGN